MYERISNGETADGKQSEERMRVIKKLIVPRSGELVDEPQSGTQCAPGPAANYSD